MIRSVTASRALAAAVFALVTAAGCGGYVHQEKLPESGATLEGTVKYGSDPVEFAMILVTAANGSATGRVGNDGHYRVDNVPVGEIKIGVNTSAGRGDYQSKVMAASASKSSAPKFIEVPAKYADPESSGLTTTVHAGSNSFNITIPK
jgi:hypothetical protein